MRKNKVISTNWKTKGVLTFETSYTNGVTDVSEVTIGDKVMVEYVSVTELGVISVTGIIKDIYDIYGNTVPELLIDASENYTAVVKRIPVSNVVSIIKLNAGEFRPIVWNKESPVSVLQDGLLEIGYTRFKPGTLSLEIKRKSFNETVYQELAELDSANIDASFTWSMRDFSTIGIKPSTSDLLFDKNGFYVYRNGDSTHPVVEEFDNNNSLIIPEGEILLIKISYSDGNVSHSISIEYTVTNADVLAVTR